MDTDEYLPPPAAAAAEEEEEEDEEEEEEEEEEEGEEEGQIEEPNDEIDADTSQLLALVRCDNSYDYEALASKKRKSNQSTPPAKRTRHEDDIGVNAEEMAEFFNCIMPKKSKKRKKRGRRKGSKNIVNREIKQKFGAANLHYAYGRYDEAKLLLLEIIRRSTNLPGSVQTLQLACETLGRVYEAVGDGKKALMANCLSMVFTQGNSDRWKLLVPLALNVGNIALACHCLLKAINADPEDISLRDRLAQFYMEVGNCKKAAETYEEISRLCPGNIQALKMATKLFNECGQHQRCVSIMEEYFYNCKMEVDLTVVDLLATTYFEANAPIDVLKLIEHAEEVCRTREKFPWSLSIKKGIIYVHLGRIEEAEDIFSRLQQEDARDHRNMIVEVAYTYMALNHYESAVKYFKMCERYNDGDNGELHLKIARCYLFMKDRASAIEYFYKALHNLDNSADARLTLASLLLEEDKKDEAISVLSPPSDIGQGLIDTSNDKCKPWWFDSRIRLKLAYIHKDEGMSEIFVDIILPLVRESLFHSQRKERVSKKLPKSVLLERVKVLEDQQANNIFRHFKSVYSSSDLSKALRAKKLLDKKKVLEEERKAAAAAAGLDWTSDSSDDENLHTLEDPPRANLFKIEEHPDVIQDLCKDLVSLGRYSVALKTINHILGMAGNKLTADKKEELQNLGAQIAYEDPISGWSCIRRVVEKSPYSFTAWNSLYKLITSKSNQCKDHKKFIRAMLDKHKDCVPALVISGHLSSKKEKHQAAARKYLEAYKWMPDCALVNLSVGTALINLALGFRLQNKQQAVVQGLSFLYNNLRLCGNSQEALYNLARAYHQVGLVSLAATYYQKVLDTRVSDSLIKGENTKVGHCGLKREAAFNLHLIYKNSGAFDLARQILKDFCSV